jgi:hypothetical protein
MMKMKPTYALAKIFFSVCGRYSSFFLVNRQPRTQETEQSAFYYHLAAIKTLTHPNMSHKKKKSL